jgi:endonuclease-3
MKRKAARATLAFSHGISLADGKAPRGKRSRSPSAEAVSVKRQRKDTHNELGDSAASPYEGYARPTAAEVKKFHAVLAKHFRERRPSRGGPKRRILDTVVGTILSQNTTNTNSHRAFQNLMGKFRTWDAVRTAKPAAVEAAIKCGGLAPKKTEWILHILRTIHKERGKTSMEYLRKLTKQEVHAELSRFTGIGKKTCAIINLFDVGHPDMAVDTHVFRYALQLRWAPSEKERAAHNKKKLGKPWPVVTRDTVYAHLDSRFPDELKYSMHLILTDTVGGLPVVCGSQRRLGFDGKSVTVNDVPLKGRPARASALKDHFRIE